MHPSRVVRGFLDSAIRFRLASRDMLTPLRLAILPLLFTSFALSAAPLRLLSYNIHHGEGNDGRIDLERIARFIEAQKPDVVFLQEVDRECRRTGNVDQPAELERLTGMKSFFAKFMDFQGGEYGQCLLTRLPMVSSNRIVLPEGAEPRASAVATLRTDHGLVTVADIHFYRTETERLAQARALDEALGDRTHPIILGGDFNSTPEDPVMEFLAARYEIPTKQGENKLTFSAQRPRIEIDYFLFCPAAAFKVAEYRVIEESVISDHFPILCVLDFVGDSP